MNYGSIPHDRIIEAFRRYVPGCYVRDYRDRGGYITVCRDYMDIRWGDQKSAGRYYRTVPRVTLCNLPRGNVTSATRYVGLKLDRPGWRLEFRRAARHLSNQQKRAITKFLKAGVVFSGVR